jgi:hypothetical protein
VRSFRMKTGRDEHLLFLHQRALHLDGNVRGAVFLRSARRGVLSERVCAAGQSVGARCALRRTFIKLAASTNACEKSTPVTSS